MSGAVAAQADGNSMPAPVDQRVWLAVLVDL